MSTARIVVLDTETTGLDPASGHRIIEIGCLEIIDRRVTGKTWHQYLNPDRQIDAGAIAVHGIRNEDLADQPRFADIADAFLEFIVGAEVVIHNASFDVGFIEHELKRMNHKRQHLEDLCMVTDSLKEARQQHPGQRNSLDALCKRYQVDNSGRDLHGALLDARLLGDVYLLMTGGQDSLSLDAEPTAADASDAADEQQMALNVRTPVIAPNESELEAHEALLRRIDTDSGSPAVWRSCDISPAK